MSSRPDEAAEKLRSAAAEARRIGAPEMQGVALAELAKLAQRAHDTAHAEEHFVKAAAAFVRADKKARAAEVMALAAVLTSTSAVERASGYLDRAIALFAADGDDERAGELSTHLAKLTLRQGWAERADAAYAAAERYFTASGSIPRALVAAYDRGEDMTSAGRPSAARQAFERALEHGAAVGQPKVSARVRISYARLEIHHHQIAKARRLLDAAEASLKDIADPQGLGCIYEARGDIALSGEAPTEALSWFERALAMYQKAGDAIGTPNVRLSLGDVAVSLGKDQEATEHFERARSEYSAIGEYGKRGIAHVERRLGDIAARAFRVKEAGRHYASAAKIYGELHYLLGVARIYGAWAKLERLSLNVKGARAHFERALAIYEALDDLPSQADTLLSLAETIRAGDEPRLARTFLERAEQLAVTRTGELSGRVQELRCALLWDEHDSKAASKCDRRLIARYRRSGDLEGEARALLRLAHQAIRAGRSADVHRLRRRLEKISRQEKDGSVRVGLLTLDALEAAASGDLRRLKEVLGEATALRGKSLPPAAALELQRAMLRGLDESLRVELGMMNDSTSLGVVEQGAWSLLSWARRGTFDPKKMAKRKADAFHVIRSAVRLRYARYLQHLGAGGEEAGQRAAEEALRALALVDSSKGGALIEALRRRVAGILHERLPSRLANEEASLVELQNEQARGAANVTPEDRRASEERIEAFLRRLREDPIGKAYAALVYPSRSLELGDSLGKDTALLEFLVDTRGVFRWYFHPQQGVRFDFWPVERADLERLVAQARTHLGARGPSRSVEAARQDVPTESAPLRTLFEGLIGADLERHISGVSKLVVVDDGILANVPIEALVIGDADGRPRYLGLETAIVHVPSANALQTAFAPSVALLEYGGALTLGDPVFVPESDARCSATGRERCATDVEADLPRLREACQARFGGRLEAPRAADQGRLFAEIHSRGDLSRLCATAAEARLVEGMFPKGHSELLTGLEANKVALMGRLKRHTYEVLHLSTHGLLSSSPGCGPTGSCLSEPAIALSATRGSPGDDLLTATEVVELERPPARIVTLAACNTGRGKLVDGEGIMSMGQAFLQTGVKTVLMSLWSIDDAATLAWMRSFYEGYGRDVDLAQLALATRRALAAEKRWSHPRYWAPFVVYGASVSSNLADIPEEENPVHRLPSGTKYQIYDYVPGPKPTEETLEWIRSLKSKECIYSEGPVRALVRVDAISVGDEGLEVTMKFLENYAADYGFDVLTVSKNWDLTRVSREQITDDIDFWTLDCSL